MRKCRISWLRAALWRNAGAEARSDFSEWFAARVNSGPDTRPDDLVSCYPTLPRKNAEGWGNQWLDIGITCVVPMGLQINF